MTTETIPMPRPELADVPPVPHGGYHHTQSTPAALDFSANINPFGPSPHVWPAMQSVVLEQHPDPPRHAPASSSGHAAQRCA